MVEAEREFEMIRQLKADNLPHTKPIHTKPEDTHLSGSKSKKPDTYPPPLILDTTSSQDSFKMIDRTGKEIKMPTTNFYKQLIEIGWDTIHPAVGPYEEG